MMRCVRLLAWAVCIGLTFTAGALAQSPGRTAAEDDVFWESVSGCTDAVEVELYIEEFGEEGRHVAEARACLETLRKAVPDTADKKTPSTEVERLLEVCEMHFAANRLTTGVGGTAVQCYREVQSLDPANRQAVEGLQRVFGKYAAWARAALERGDAVKTRGHVEKLKGLAPEAPEVAELEGAIARLKRQAAEEQEKAEAERKAPKRTTLAPGRNKQFFPLLVYRTGPYASLGIPSANGRVDYFKLVNERDGGINGVKITWEECEFQYNTKQGVECYERLKNKGSTGATIIFPSSAGVTYQLIPRAAVDEIPIHSMGYGQTAAADGRVFKWAFNFPTTYWSQASAFIRYVGEQEGGMKNLAGKKIALIHHSSVYGREPIPTLQILSEKYGYDLNILAVDHPGQEQKATWLQIRRYKPDWIFLWGWGVMNQVAVKEAAAINFPMDHFIGGWWSGSENDVIPAGDAAIGYKAGHFHGVGAGYPVHDDIINYVYGGDAEAAKANNLGQVPYNRGMAGSMFAVEAVRTAQAKFGNRPLTGAEVRWGMENLDITAERLVEIGMKGFILPLKVSCEDHETMGPVLIQQWDGEKWNVVSDWIEPVRDVVRPMIEEVAAMYAAENNITPRDCSIEG